MIHVFKHHQKKILKYWFVFSLAASIVADSQWTDPSVSLLSLLPPSHRRDDVAASIARAPVTTLLPPSLSFPRIWTATRDFQTPLQRFRCLERGDDESRPLITIDGQNASLSLNRSRLTVNWGGFCWSRVFLPNWGFEYVADGVLRNWEVWQQLVNWIASKLYPELILMFFIELDLFFSCSKTCFDTSRLDFMECFSMLFIALVQDLFLYDFMMSKIYFKMFRLCFSS